MIYIKREKVEIEKLTCSHPKVSHIWEIGALAAIPNSVEMKRIICLSIIGEKESKQFEDDGLGQAVVDAEKYLQSLGATRYLLNINLNDNHKSGDIFAFTRVGLGKDGYRKVISTNPFRMEKFYYECSFVENNPSIFLPLVSHKY